MSRYTESRQQLQMSPEEKTVLKNCLDKSFWTHSVPVSIIGITALKYSSMKGFKPGIFSYAFTLVGSLITGRVFAIPNCLQEMVNKYPNGAYAQWRATEEGRLKQRTEDFLPPTFEADPSEQAPAMIDSDYEKSSAQHKQTYDDLRRRNREQYLYAQKPAQRAPAAAPDASVHAPPPMDQYASESLYSGTSPSSSYFEMPTQYEDSYPSVATKEDEAIPKRRKRLNKYGDEIED